jgi:hypothetical protein
VIQGGTVDVGRIGEELQLCLERIRQERAELYQRDRELERRQIATEAQLQLLRRLLQESAGAAEEIRDEAAEIVGDGGERPGAGGLEFDAGASGGGDAAG